MRIPNVNGIIATATTCNDLIGTNSDGAGDQYERNIISGNTQDGIQFIGPAFDDVVAGNDIGTGLGGVPDIVYGQYDGPHGTEYYFGNGQFGIALLGGGTGNLIGISEGAADAAAGCNVIADNGSGGIRLSSPGGTNTLTQTVIVGNDIGTDITGLTPFGNYGQGILIQGANDTQIGGSGDLSNIIAYNTSLGVLVASGAGNTIRENSLFDNEGGIDIGDNERLNAPVLGSVVVSNSSTVVSGTLTGAAGTTFILDFYANPAKDPGGYYEGQTWLGSYSVCTNELGIATFQATGLEATSPGNWITATATDSAGTTWEFSAAISQPPVAVAGPNQTVTEGTNVTLDGSESTHPNGYSLTYSWNFGDGQTATGPIVTHVYDAGVYTAMLTVSDSLGGTSTAVVTVTANYVPPQVLSTVDNVQEAAPVTVPNPFSNMYAGGQYTYLWHLIASTNGDTVPDSTDPDLSFTPYDVGTYTFQVTDTDNGSFSTSTDVTVIVADTSPTAFLSPELWFDPDVAGVISLAGAYDPSPGKTAAGFHYAFATDGASLSGATYANTSASPSETLTFPALGDHTVTARIIDRNGGYTDYTAVLDVVPATVYTVDQTTDSGIGTGTTGDLRYVIDQANANANPAGSLITFDPTFLVGPQMITLSTSLGTLDLTESAGPEVIDGPGTAC